MSQTLSSLLKVSIDFEQSHLFFPRIVISLLVIMLVLIALVNHRRLVEIVRTRGVGLAFFEPDADKFRLFATLGLVVVYFVSMDALSPVFPNTGLSFLFCSMAFIFVLSLVYLHEYSRRTLLAVCLNALISPLVAWYVLGSLFDITLP